MAGMVSRDNTCMNNTGRPRRRLSLILESSLTSNQRHGHPPPEKEAAADRESFHRKQRQHSRNVSFEDNAATAACCDQYDRIDKSQRTQRTADLSESSIPATVIVIGKSNSTRATAPGEGGGGGGSSSVSVGSFQSALTADTVPQVVPPVGGGSVMRIDVDLDATAAAPASTAMRLGGEGRAAAPAPADRRRTPMQHRTSAGPVDLTTKDAAAVGVANAKLEERRNGSERVGGGFVVPSAKELLRRAEAKMIGSSKRSTNSTKGGKVNAASWTKQQEDGADAHRRISSRRSLPTHYANAFPSEPLPTSRDPLRSSTSQPNLTRLTHQYAAQDPGFRKRFSDFVRDQLSTDGGEGGESNNGADADDDDVDAAMAERIRRVGSYGNSLDQLRGHGSTSSNKRIGEAGGAEMAHLMLNGGHGTPAHRRRNNAGSNQHHHNHQKHIQRLDDGGRTSPLPTDSRVTTIKLDNILVQICNTHLTHFLRRERHYRWLSSFRRLDPRYQILTFFNDVSREGGENVGRLHEFQSTRDINPLLRGFVKASAFSVWRPTSNEAIYKMMRGETVGKGLDVKGKSARRGVLSGYIPFVQIHDEDDKRRVRRPPREGRFRVYYQSEEARDAARRELTLFAAHASHAVTKARQVIAAGEGAVTEDLWERALKYEMILDVEDSMIYPLDNYAEQGRFGLDVSERYFVEVSIVGRDICRPAGSEWDVGRNSEPAFQDMNSACVRAFDGKMNRAVILQMDGNADADPLQPQTFVVAYEEHGRVIPVASDFDAFLVGTRGVNFNDPLPQDQVAMMTDMIEDINGILSSPASMDSWTVRWLEVLKKKASKNSSSSCSAMAQYGYGDPKSYDMMEAVARRLEASSGAVRHGPECFNIAFPQEIDDQYLVVCDSLPGKIPWKYVDAHELQNILCERIEVGFAFPLNPKWVLCDPGWKRVWDKLLASDDLMIQQSLDMWYPPSSGIRERIEEIYRNHPEGFQRRPQATVDFAIDHARSDSLRRSIDHSQNEGTEAMDLAEQELKYYMIKKRAKTKLKAALMFRKLRSSSTPQKAPKVSPSLPQEDVSSSPVACKAVSILAGGW